MSVERFDDAVDGRPTGDVYDWYQLGSTLLDQGHPAAAAELLRRVAAAEPAARQVRETLARALLTGGQYSEAEREFARLVDSQPDDDYARVGLGLALARQGRHQEAVEHLALAVAMRPDRDEYARPLQQVRATLRAQARLGGPLA